MKRRNLMIGLGVLGTGAGAVSLTGATLSDTVSPSADFQVNVEGEDLVIKRSESSNFDGSTIDTSGDSDIPDGRLVYEDEIVEGSELDDNTDFSAAADTAVNNNLEFGVLIPFESMPRTGDGDSLKQFIFPNLLQATNNSGSVIRLVASDLSVSVGGGPDGDGGFVSTNGNNHAFSANDMRDMFNFTVNTGEGSTSNISQIIDAGSPVIGSAAEIQPGDTIDINLSVNITPEQGDTFADEFKDQGLDQRGGQINLMDTVTFGTFDGPEGDLFGGFVTPATQ